jgi:hypothetical protein
MISWIYISNFPIGLFKSNYFVNYRTDNNNRWSGDAPANAFIGSASVYVLAVNIIILELFAF